MIYALVIAAFCGTLGFPQGVITTYAGADLRFRDEGKLATEARLGLPAAVALDSRGNLFFTDGAFSMVLKVSPDGRLSVVADSSKVNSPRGLAVDTSGNLYVSESPEMQPFGHILKIANDGTITTVAGAGTNTDGEDVPATEARLEGPNGLTIDRAGNLYVAETWRNRVRRIGTDGKIRTVAGDGRREGFGPPARDVGDGGPATEASLRYPMDVAIDREGGLLIADSQNYRIRRVALDGTISTIAGGGRGPIGEGTAPHIDFDGPLGIAAASDGSIYVFDWYGITRIAPDGKANIITSQRLNPGPGDNGPASEATIHTVNTLLSLGGLAVDSEGNLYIAEARQSLVRRIGRDGIITTVAGNSSYRFGGDGGPAPDALMSSPGSLAVSGDYVFVLDTGNCRVRGITPHGTIQTIAGNGYCLSSIDVRRASEEEPALEVGLGGAFVLAARPSGSVLVGDGLRVLEVTPSGRIRPVVNAMGAPGGFGDFTGPAIDARLAGLVIGLYVDREGNQFIADAPSNRVRKVTPAGVISTFAGSGPAPGPPTFSGDGGPAAQARLAGPSAITGDSRGNLYILDAGNARIRKVARDGTITTIAGTGRPGSTGDGGLATEANIVPFGPFGGPALAADDEGNVYLTDPSSHKVRRISADGIITTIAGTGQRGFDGDGGPADKAKFDTPTGIALDGAGNVYVSDSGNRRIRKIQR